MSPEEKALKKTQKIERRKDDWLWFMAGFFGGLLGICVLAVILTMWIIFTPGISLASLVGEVFLPAPWFL